MAFLSSSGATGRCSMPTAHLSSLLEWTACGQAHHLPCHHQQMPERSTLRIISIMYTHKNQIFFIAKG